MGVLTRLLSPADTRASLANPPSWLINYLSGNGSSDTATGLTVTPDTGLNNPSVLAATRVLAEGVASLPLIVYERQERGKRRAEGHRLYRLLHDSPNTEMTTFEWLETAMGHLALWGNHYSEIERNGAGQVMSLWPLRPDRMTVSRERGDLQYSYRLNNGSEVPLQPDQVFHVRGLGSNGIVGYSLITLARQAIGLGMAAEEFGARFFGNGARPGTVLQHPGSLSDQAYARLRDSWEARHQGLSNSQRVAILEEGMTVETIGIPPEDAQFLETRKFQVAEIARIFRVPPHMIGDLDRATFSNIEQQSLEFVIYCLRPWLVRWEKRITESLMTQQERQRYFAEFLVDGLLRGDTASRYSAYAVGRQWGWLSANDIRELENMNPLPGDEGDVYLSPMNMVPAGQLEDVIKEEAPAPAEDRSLADVCTQTLPGDYDVAHYHGPDLEFRAANDRRRLAAAYRTTLIDQAQRIVNREVNDIGNAARRYLGRERDPQSFRAWLAKFLEEHTAFVRRYLEPVLVTYAKLVAREVERETGRQIDDEELQEWLGEYMNSRSNVWVARLGPPMRVASDDAEDPAAAVEAELEQRQETYAGKWAMDESVRGSNAVAKTLYAIGGVTALVWRTVGDSCPYCRSLNGVTVQINGWFVNGGEDYQPEGAPTVLRPRSNVGHPPLHAGCDCMIVASLSVM